MHVRRHAWVRRGDWSAWILRCEYRGRGVCVGTHLDETVDRDPVPRMWFRRRRHRWEDPSLLFILILILGPITLKLAIDDYDY